MDQARSQIELEAAEITLHAAETQRRADGAGLAAAVGVDPHRPLGVTQTDLSALERAVAPADSLTRAVAVRPEVSVARARVAGAGESLAAAEAQRWPQVAVAVSGSLEYSMILRGLGLGGTAAVAGIRASVSWDAWDVGLARAADERAANVKVLQRELDNTLFAVRLEVEQRTLEVRAAQSGLSQSQHLLASVTTNLSMSKERYREGVAPLLEVLDAERAAYEAEFSLIRARLVLHVAQLRLVAVASPGELKL